MTCINWNIIGHKRQLATIESKIMSGQISHAYLLSGPKQVGKFTIAKKMASWMQSGEMIGSEPKSLPDISIIDDDGNSFKIAQIREVARKASLTHSSNYQIILIKNIDRMPTEAQNAFLKTLEEPQPKNIFILTTSRLDNILPTIVSRVRHHRFSTVNPDLIHRELSPKYSHQLTDQMIRWSQGKPGLILDWLNQTDTFEKWQTVYQKINRFFIKNDLAAKFLFIDEILAKKQNSAKEVELFLDIFAYSLRELMLTKLDTKNVISTDLKKLANLFDILQKTRYFIGRNVNKKLALENLLIQTEK